MSLRMKYANDIAEAMASSLQDTEFTGIFKAAALEKFAGQAFDAFKADVDAEVAAARAEKRAIGDLRAIYTKHLPALQQEENTEPGTLNKAQAYMASVAKTPGGTQQPGTTFPPAADDECVNCDDPQTTIARNFTIEKLVKLADTLDAKGFIGLASALDETIQKIAWKGGLGTDEVKENEKLWSDGPGTGKRDKVKPWKGGPGTDETKDPSKKHTYWTDETKKVSNPLVKKVQQMLGVNPDGNWGPKTVAAWNAHVKTQPGYELMGMDPSGEQRPSDDVMNAVLRLKQDKPIKPGVDTP